MHAVIVIPMAGLSRRFTEAGYDRPKYMLDVSGKPMFRRAIESFRHYFDEEDFLFVYRDIAGTHDFLRSELATLGLAEARVHLVALDAPTSGQAETVALGLRHIKADPAAELTIFNIDSIRPDFVHPLAVDRTQVDGYVEVFRGAGDHWSFVRGESRDLRSGRALEVAEKVRISDLCSTGLYWFRRVDLFLDLYGETEARDPADLQGGERYVAPLYQRAIERGHVIDYAVIRADQVDFAGTPDEYETLRRRPPTANTTALCLSGQVRGGADHFAELAEAAAALKADVFISTWTLTGAKSLDGGTAQRQMIRVFGEHFEALPTELRRDARLHFPRLNMQIKTASLREAEPFLRQFFPDAVCDVEEESFDLSFPHADANSLRMLYKIWRCARMRRLAEKRRGHRYEMVIRLRPDVLPNVESVMELRLQPDEAHFSGGSAAGLLGDMMWVTDSETDDKIVSLYSRALSPDHDWLGIHEELTSHLERSGVTGHVDRGIQRKRLAESFSKEEMRANTHQLAEDLLSSRYTGLPVTDEIARSIGALLRHALDRPEEDIGWDLLETLSSSAPQTVAAALVLNLQARVSQTAHASDPSVQDPDMARAALLWCMAAYRTADSFSRALQTRANPRHATSPAVWHALGGIHDVLSAPDVSKAQLPVVLWAKKALRAEYGEAGFDKRRAETTELLAAYPPLTESRLKWLVHAGRDDDAMGLARAAQTEEADFEGFLKQYVVRARKAQARKLAKGTEP